MQRNNEVNITAYKIVFFSVDFEEQFGKVHKILILSFVFSSSGINVLELHQP